MANTKNIESAYQLAKERYAELGVDTDKAIEKLSKISISLHCWQTDDVGGFESGTGGAGGGTIATGNYPGKSRSMDEMKNDLEKVYSLIPGKHRLALHANYGDFGGKKVDRDAMEPKHFQTWVDWAKKIGIGLDFNSTFFSHPLAESGMTLAHADDKIRKFWIEHAKRCREISAHMGKELNNRCIHNIWIPDGSKDVTVNRLKHRELLVGSLDEILKKKYTGKEAADSLESKVFGIGSESYVVGSHEFYMGYAVKNNMMYCLDMGHFHPTESVGDKISSMLLFIPELMTHISRGIRWDSDHVVIVTDELNMLTHEIIRGNFLSKVNIGLDFFDASINRMGAYVIGTRATQKSFLMAMLEPVEKIRAFENAGKGFEKLAMMEEAKELPHSSVWDYFCLKQNVPIGEAYIAEIQKYEGDVLSKRK
jgi:L-rhamnose isomerase